MNCSVIDNTLLGYTATLSLEKLQFLLLYKHGFKFFELDWEAQYFITLFYPRKQVISSGISLCSRILQFYR
jgi:hypothetical protein